jgi:hypothetical protein
MDKKNLIHGYLSDAAAQRLPERPCAVWYRLREDLPHITLDVWIDEGGEVGRRIGGSVEVADLQEVTTPTT